MTASFHTDSDRPTTGLDSETVVERAALDDDAWAALVDRLNRQSVDKHHDAYLDVDWDHPDNAIRQDDPRWIKAAEGLVGETDWWARSMTFNDHGLGCT
jgi:hypothetical protein